MRFLDFRSEKYVTQIDYLVKTRMNMGEIYTYTNLKFISHMYTNISKTTIIKKLCKFKILSYQGVVIMKRSQILGLQRIFNMSRFSMKFFDLKIVHTETKLLSENYIYVMILL